MRKAEDLKCVRLTWVVFVAFAVIIFATPGAMQPANAQRLIAVTPPPMGWSSWNSFSNTVDAKVVMDQAKAMVANGMAKAGYQYINIDEGWWLGQHDAQGNIVVDPRLGLHLLRVSRPETWVTSSATFTAWA
jgi:hypothetical protein